MILEKISNSKIRITFHSGEVYKYSFLNTDINSPKMKNFLLFLIKYAAIKTGFETNGRILIQSHIQNSNLIFLLTRISKSNLPTDVTPHTDVSAKPTASHPETLHRKKCLQQNHTYKPSKLHISSNCGKNVFFVFENQKHLADFLCAVKNEDFSSAKLYTLSGKYYLKADRKTHLANNAIEFSNPIFSFEFAKHIKSNAHLICSGNDFKKFF